VCGSVLTTRSGSNEDSYSGSETPSSTVTWKTSTPTWNS
jgi:hypothetical protein